MFGCSELSPYPARNEEESPLLQTMLFTLAGAFAGSHIKLQVWTPPDEWEPSARPMRFPADLWSPAGCSVLAKCLTKFEVHACMEIAVILMWMNCIKSVPCACSFCALQQRA